MDFYVKREEQEKPEEAQRKQEIEARAAQERHRLEEAEGRRQADQQPTEELRRGQEAGEVQPSPQEPSAQDEGQLVSRPPKTTSTKRSALLVVGGLALLVTLGVVVGLAGVLLRDHFSSTTTAASQQSPSSPKKAEAPPSPGSQNSSSNRQKQASETALRQAVGDYYSAVDREDWDYTYNHLDSQTIAQFTREEWFQKNQYFADTENLELSSIDVQVDGSTTDPVVSMTVYRTFKDGTSINRDTFFVWEGGEWKHRFGQEENKLYLPDTSYEEFVAQRGNPPGAGPSVDEESAVEEAVRSHYEAIGSGNFEKAYSSFGPSFRSKIQNNKQGWINSERSYQITGTTINSLKVNSVSGDQAKATVDVSVQDNTGTPRFLITWHLLKEDGLWKLDYQGSSEKIG